MNYIIKLLIFRDFTKNYIYINSVVFNENKIKNNVQDFFGNLFFSAVITSRCRNLQKYFLKVRHL